jgi:LAS superfamily LD-carboxypeptidase LdcB
MKALAFSMTFLRHQTSRLPYRGLGSLLCVLLFAGTALSQATAAVVQQSSDAALQCKYGGQNIGYDSPERMINPVSIVGKGKNEGLWASYTPDELVDIDYEFMTPLYRESMLKEAKSEQLTPLAYQALKSMLTKAHAERIDVFVHSAYRSYEIQCRVFSYKVLNEIKTQKTNLLDAVTAVNTRSALPGTSEHQMGTSVDLVTFLPKYELPDKPKFSGYAVEYEMQNTPAFQWLRANAHLYGYVLSYPQADAIEFTQANPKTGYIYEPWHWRYIGAHYAKKFKVCEKNKMVLRDFLYKIAYNPKYECK